MSHFSVAVFSQTPGDVEALLASFDEQVEAGSPYAEFVRNEEYDWDKTVGAKGYWRNPNARWDWWEIGGRWRGLLRLRPGKSGYTATLDRWHSDFVYPPPLLRRGAGRRLRFFTARGADPAGGAHVGSDRGRR